MNENLTTLFRTSRGIITLMDKDRKPVGAVYLDKLRMDIDQLIVCESTSVDEKYYVYFGGITVFFTYFQKN